MTGLSVWEWILALLLGVALAVFALGVLLVFVFG